MDKASKKKILFIFCATQNQRKRFLNTYKVIAPLVAAILKALTPPHIEFIFCDDRLEKINYDLDVDMVLISAKTHTVIRAYEIATEFRKRNKYVVLGGIHVSLLPDEAKEYADTIVIGEAENTYPQLLKDFENGCIKPLYQVDKRASLANLLPDRSIYKNRKYFPVNLVETSRGCNFNCKFCSVTTIYKHKCINKPIEDVIQEIKSLKSNKHILFTDDNICADITRAKELFKALIPLKITWESQISSNALLDEELVELMRKSGCKAVLIGFETLDLMKLKAVNKEWNRGKELYQKVADVCHKNNFLIFGTFIFGNDNDSEDTFKEVFDFAQKNCFFYAGFHNLTPFPGTILYEEMYNELINKTWWFDKTHMPSAKKFVYNPKCMPAEKLTELCIKYENKFYTLPYILSRTIRLKGSLLNKFFILFGGIHKYFFHS